MKPRLASVRTSLCALLPIALIAVFAGSAASAVLDPLTLTKYMDPLPVPSVLTGQSYYEIGAYEIQQQLHSQLPPAHLYGYGTSQATASYPGPTIVVRKGVPIDVRWTNHLGMTHLLDYAFDHTIPMAHTTTGVPITTHVHGGEQEPASDGGPMTWFTPGFAEKGHDWKKEVLHYANNQLASTIWYHDHAFGFTRHNVYAGLAGFYIVTDPANEPAGLPSGPYDLGLAIQDRMLTTDGQLWYPNVGITSEHPVWIPEFFGNVILVNGKAWPYLNVEPRKYRFRVLEGSNARFYSLALAERTNGTPGPAFRQIATDGGYLPAPVVLNDPANPMSPRLVIAPGERAEIIVDFSGYNPGTEFILRNTAKAPYPSGETADPKTTGQIMLFRVVPLTSPDPSVIPASLVPMTRLSNPTVTRVMTLNEMASPLNDEPIGALLNGMNFHDGAVTEFPVLGTTEMWEVANLTGDTHPIHIHLVQFQLLNRQKYNARGYQVAFAAANPELPTENYVPVPVGPYLKGKPVPVDPNERGWKDTFRMNPGEVSRILVRWAPQDESPAFSFDATAEPGYVWHCHILEHEENDMMRPFHVVAPAVQAAQGRLAPASPEIAATTLGRAYPNPTRDGAKVRFTLRAEGQASLEIFNVAGQRVRTLARGTFGAGEHDLSWDGADDQGRTLGAGVYFVRFQGDGTSHNQKLLVTR